MGQFKVLGGSVVVVAPDDAPQAEDAGVKTVLEASKGAITVKVEGDKDVSQVTDAETEALSSKDAKEVREANEKAAAEARVEVKSRKAGNSVVATGTFNDIDLPEYDQKAKAPKEKKAKAEKAEKPAEKTQSAEEVFNAALEEALNQQNEDYVEDYEQDK